MEVGSQRGTSDLQLSFLYLILDCVKFFLNTLSLDRLESHFFFFFSWSLCYGDGGLSRLYTLKFSPGCLTQESKRDKKMEPCTLFGIPGLLPWWL